MQKDFALTPNRQPTHNLCLNVITHMKPVDVGGMISITHIEPGS